MPANNASRLVGTSEVEYPAPAEAKPPISPATGCRPAALNTSAASGGTTTKTASPMTDAVTPITPTAYGSTHGLELPKVLRMSAESMPECSATPTASRMGSTGTSGGKPM